MNSLKDVFSDLKEISLKYSTPLPIETPADNCTWLNLKFNTNNIRYGHLEYFKSNNDKVEVVHSTCYPGYNVSLPVFGFDIISLNKKVTGIFCDITPSPYDHSCLRDIITSIYNEYKNDIRSLPEWAEFFSPHFIAVSPEHNSWESIANKCQGFFDLYLNASANIGEYLNDTDSLVHKNGQNYYSLQQQKNTKTMKALSVYIGEEAAKAFISEVLFPTSK